MSILFSNVTFCQSLKMLNEWLHNLIGRFTHLRLNLFFVGSYDWDPKSRQFITTNNFIHWNGLLVQACGWLFLVLMLNWLVLKFFDEQTFETSISVASHFTGWMEFSVFLLLLLIYHRLDKSRDQVIFTLNQMFNHANNITGINISVRFCFSKSNFDSKINLTINLFYTDLIQSRRIQLSKHFQRKIRGYQYIFLFVCTMCTGFPFGFAFAVCVPFEPLHVLFDDLLEINLTLNLIYFPHLIILIWLMSTMATFALQCISLCLGYTILGTSCSEFMIPTNITIKLVQPSTSQVNQLKYQIKTMQLGILDENTVIHLFRCCQIINKLANDVLACIEISFLHVVLLVMYVVLSYMVIVGQDLIFGNEALVAFVIVGLFTSLFVEFQVATMTDEIVTASTKFVSKS